MDTGVSLLFIAFFVILIQIIIWVAQKVIERRATSEGLVTTVVKGNVKASETIIGSLAELSGALEKLDHQ